MIKLHMVRGCQKGARCEGCTFPGRQRGHNRREDLQSNDVGRIMAHWPTGKPAPSSGLPSGADGSSSLLQSWGLLRTFSYSSKTTPEKVTFIAMHVKMLLMRSWTRVATSLVTLCQLLRTSCAVGSWAGRTCVKSSQSG